MASPNFDALNLQHSKNIGDPVAAAGTDGKRWSSAQRTYHLNEAIRRWIRKQYIAGMSRESRSQDAGRAWESLGSYVVQSSETLSSSSLAFSSFSGGAPAHIIAVYNVTDGVVVKRLPQKFVSYANSNANSFLASSSSNEYWYSEGDKLHIDSNSEGSASALVSVIYVKRHTDLSVAGASDIAVPSNSWDQIQDLAFKVAMEEVGDSESAARGILKEQIVNGEIA